MASSSVLFSSRSYPWQQQTSKTSFFSHHSNPFISLSTHSPPPPTTIFKAFNKFVNVCKLSTNDNTPAKAISAFQPIKSPGIIGINSFKLLFRRRSLWRRSFFASKNVRAIILLNVITIIYASDIPVLKEVEVFMYPDIFNVVRFSLSAIPFLPATFRARNNAHIWKAGAELGLWVSLAYRLQAFGLLTSNVGRASFIAMITVIMIPLLDGMFGAVILPLTWFRAIVYVVGITILESSGSPPNVGDLFNFLSTIFFGVHMLRTEKILRTTKKENFIPLLGYEMDALRDVSAIKTSIIYGLEPILGAGFAWFHLGERWGTTGWIGAALVIGGSLIA